MTRPGLQELYRLGGVGRDGDTGIRAQILPEVCNHGMLLESEGWGRGYKRADGELCNGGHLFSKLKIRTRSERIFLLLELRAAVWERRFGCLPEGWYF